ncbi:MAG: tryptophan synthase subunit beta, partial [Pseudomonadota bacterium]
HSIAAGLDYPGVGPEHGYLKDLGRVHYVTATDSEALAAFHALAGTEGILPALESAHALAYLLREAGNRRRDEIIVLCLSGRGDKDVDQVARLSGVEL